MLWGNNKNGSNNYKLREVRENLRGFNHISNKKNYLSLQETRINLMRQKFKYHI